MSAHKPSLDEMGLHAMLPVRKGKTRPRKPQPPSRSPGGETSQLAPSYPPPPGSDTPDLSPSGPPPPGGEGLGVGGTPPSAARAKPPRTVEVPSETERRGRRGRPRKTGRPVA